MPASGNVAPDNPDLALFGVGPSAHKQTPVAGVDGRASDPPRRAFVRRLETVMWRENAVHVEALAGGDGRGVLESQAGARRVAGERGRTCGVLEHHGLPAPRRERRLPATSQSRVCAQRHGAVGRKLVRRHLRPVSVCVRWGQHRSTRGQGWQARRCQKPASRTPGSMMASARPIGAAGGHSPGKDAAP